MEGFKVGWGMERNEVGVGNAICLMGRASNGKTSIVRTLFSFVLIPVGGIRLTNAHKCTETGAEGDWLSNRSSKTKCWASAAGIIYSMSDNCGGPIAQTKVTGPTTRLPRHHPRRTNTNMSPPNSGPSSLRKRKHSAAASSDKGGGLSRTYTMDLDGPPPAHRGRLQGQKFGDTRRTSFWSTF